MNLLMLYRKAERERDDSRKFFFRFKIYVVVMLEAREHKSYGAGCAFFPSLLLLQTVVMRYRIPIRILPARSKSWQKFLF
jgi:hypothetical protein